MAQSVLQCLAVLLIFGIVLALTYYATKWLAKSGAIQTQSANIKVVETFKIAPNRYIQIVQIGTKYYSIGVSKDSITFLSELEEEQLDLTKPSNAQVLPFKDIFKNAVGKKRNKDE